MVNFFFDVLMWEDGDVSILVYNFYWVVDKFFYDIFWLCVVFYVLVLVNGCLVCGFNCCF